jgi:DNA-binding transcriptional regulator YiaG
MTAQEIRAARLLLGLTQAELAHELGVIVGTVYSWESGRTRVSGPVEKLIQIMLERRRGGKK